MVLPVSPVASSSARSPMLCGPRLSEARPEPRDDAVLADQRHDVGERADRGNLDEGRQPLRLARSGAQRLHQLQRDADAGEMLVRIGAVVALRIDHRQRDRQRGVRLVMVGDDQIDPELAGAQRRLGAADAAVDRDDQRDAIGMQPVDRRGLQPVAVLDPLGNEVHHLTAEHLEGPAQDHRRGDPVDVVVAVDGDPLLARQRLLEPDDRPVHVGELERIVELVERRVQEASGELGILRSLAGTAAAPPSGAASAPRRESRPPRRHTAGAARGAASCRGHSAAPAGASRSMMPPCPIWRNLS